MIKEQYSLVNTMISYTNIKNTAHSGYSRYAFKALLTLALGTFLLGESSILRAQTDTLFWFSAPEVNRYHSSGTATNPQNFGRPVYLRMTTQDLPATVTISMPANEAYFNGGNPIVITMGAGETYSLDMSSFIENATIYGSGGLPGNINLPGSIENVLAWTSSNLFPADGKPYINKNNKGIKIKSTADITVYYEISVQYNMDLIALKGQNGLGTQFFVPFQTSNDTRSYPFAYRPYNSIDIVATEDNTKINITVPRPIWVKDVGSRPLGTYSIWLNKGETSIIPSYANNTAGHYQTSFAANARLAGAYIEVDQIEGSGKPITVITHDDLVQSRFSLNPDYVTDQLVPIEHIGTDYAVIQGVGYSAFQIEDEVFIVGTENGTSFTVKRGPAGVTTNHNVNRGGSVHVTMNNQNYRVLTVKSDKPVYVLHMSGAGRQKAGAIIPTISMCTGSNRVAFNRTKGGAYAFYLNILAWAHPVNSAIGHFTLLRDGIPVSSADDIAVENAINNHLNFNPLPETGYPFDNWQYARIDASQLTANAAYMLVNDRNVFHLGVLNGQTDNDAFYGYFSNFNKFSANAIVIQSGSSGNKICSGESLQLRATGGATYSWDPTTHLDNPFISNPTAYNITSSLNYKVTVSGACDLTDSAYIDIQVGGPITASFDADRYAACAAPPVGNPSGTPGYEFTFTSTSTGDNIREWRYQQGANPPVTFKYGRDVDPDDARTATLWIENNTDDIVEYDIWLYTTDMAEICAKEIKKTVRVFPYIGINASHTISGNANCQPLTVNFTSTPIGHSNDATYLWTFGDGNSAPTQNATNTYYNTAPPYNMIPYTAQVKIIDQWNVCRDSASRVVNVPPYLEASFTAQPIEGCSPLNVANLTDKSKGALNRTWRLYRDGIHQSTGPTPPPLNNLINTKTNNTATIYRLEFEVESSTGCHDTYSQEFKVYPNPNITLASLRATPSSTECSPLTVDYEVEGIVNTNTYWWLLETNAIDDGDIITFTPPATANGSIDLVNYTDTPVTRYFSFEATNNWGCTRTWGPIPVVVPPYIEANIVIDPEEVCPDPVTGLFDVDILDASLLADGYYQWTVNGVTLPPNTNPGPLNDGRIQFDYTTLTLNGDGSADIPVSLSVYNSTGCVATDSRTIHVHPWVTGSFTASVGGSPIANNEQLCAPVTIHFNSAMTHADSHHWQFGSLGASLDVNPDFEFTNAGDTPYNVTVKLTANSDFGCKAEYTQTYTILPEVKANFSLNTTAGCVPLTIEATAPDIAGVTYNWDFNGETPTGHSQTFGTITSNTTGGPSTYTINLQAHRGICHASSSIDITVYPQVRAQWDFTDPSDYCHPVDDAVFQNTSDLYVAPNPVNNIQWEIFDSGALVTSSGDQSFVPTLPNSSHTTPKTYDVVLTATSDDGCVDTHSGDITVYPTPYAMFNVDIAESCTPMEILVTDASETTDPGDYTWSWGGGTTTSTGSPWVVEYDNPPPSNSDVPVTINLDLINTYGCTDHYSHSFNVPPQVDAAITLATVDTICGGQSITFANNSTGGAPGTLTYSWDFDDGTSPVVTTNLNQVTHTFINNTNNPITRNVTLTVTNSRGCQDISNTIPVTIYPRVVAAQSFIITDVCNGTTIDLSNASSNTLVTNPNATNSYQWNFTTGSPNGANVTVNYPGNALGGINLTNTHQTDPIVYNVGFTATTVWNSGTAQEHTCSNATTGENITVYPLLDVIYDTPPAVCSGLNGATLEFDKNPASSGGHVNDVVLEWSFGDGNTLSTNFVPTVSHLIENLSNVDYITPTTIVAHQVATGCTQTRHVNVRVHPKVESRFTFTIPDPCAYPLQVDFVNSSVFHDLQPGVQTTFHWDYGNSGVGGAHQDETLLNSNPHSAWFYNDNPNATATYQINLTVSQHHDISDETCSDDLVKTVTVYPELIADFSLSPDKGCNPLDVSFVNSSAGVLASQGGNYEWTFGDNTGSTLAAPAVKTYSHTDKTQSKFFPVILTVTNPLGCEKINIDTVEVLPLVVADFFVDVLAGCTPLDVPITNTSTSPAYVYQWTFAGNGANPSQPNSNLDQPGTITFTNPLGATDNLVVQNPLITLVTRLNQLEPQYRCPKTTSQSVAVYPHIYPEFTGDFDGCHPHPVAFNNTTNAFGGTGNATYLWRFGNNVSSDQVNPTQTYYNSSFTNDATFNVKLKATSEHGCKDSVYHDVVVYPKPKAAMELLGQYISCPPLDAEFDNQSLGTNLTYHFDFGDGTDTTTTNADNILHSYGNTFSDDDPWPYTITLTTTTEHGCEDFTTQTVYVFPEVHVAFSFDPDEGCNPHTPVIHNNTSASAFYYNWNFDDGFTSYLFEPIHRFVNNTTDDREFHVSLNAVSAYGCEDTQEEILTVFAAPIADFATNPPLSVFPNATFQFINFSSPADPAWYYLWNYGDGYGDDQPHIGNHTHTYETWGPKEDGFRRLVTLEIWNDNCYDSVHHYITLLPPVPVVLFEADHYQSCSPLQVYFINNSMYGDSCLWDFGYFDDDGNPVTSTVWEPYHEFVEPGYYNVGLKVWGDGGENYYFATFQVWENPIARFEVLPEHVMLPEATVRIFNLSENAYRSVWDLGDGTITTVRDPIHTYKELGEYRITLTVYTENGCEDTDSRYPAVWVEGTGFIKFPNAFVPNPNGSNGGYYDAVDFANEVFHPYADGVTDYRLMVFNRWGEQIFESKDIKIGWDGYYNGKICDQGVYVWRAIGRFTNGKQFDVKGNVTLLR